jgi:copper transport protein
MPTEPLITWPDPLVELASFVAGFLMTGAVGFRFACASGLLKSAVNADRAFALHATRRAAWLGMLGCLVTAAVLAQALPGQAAERHHTVLELVMAPQMALRLGLLLVALIGFALATRGGTLGWALAAGGVLISPVRAVFFGQIQRVVNPVHMLAGGLWIGTLTILVFVGIRPALRALAADRRGPVVAAMVNGFSPVALGAVGLLATMGVITAWTHLHRLDALWTTPYGYALITKLSLVSVVLGLGALNWRRRKPKLGSEAGARALLGSAMFEVIGGALVLMVTAVLVALPSPR